MKVLAICMKKEVERRALLERGLKDHNFDYEFIDAVDGRTLSESDPLKAWVADHDASRLLTGRTLGKGEVGCFLSHVVAWERAIELGEPAVLIVESDVQVEKSLFEILDWLYLNTKLFDLVCMHYSKCWPSFFGKIKINHHHNLVRFANSRSYSTGAYVISRFGALKLMAYLRQHKICMPPDDFMTGGRLQKDLNTYAIHPPCIQLSDLAAFSTIEQDRSGEKDFPGNSSKEREGFRKLGRDIKIFFSRLFHCHTSM